MEVYCINCTGIVTKRMHAIRCDGCNGLQHRVCKTGASTGVTSDQYKSMKKGALDMEWNCQTCTTAHEPSEPIEVLTESPTSPALKCLPVLSPASSPVRELNTTYIVRSDAREYSDILGADDRDPETPVDESLHDPNTEDVSETYEVIEGGSKRGGKKLVRGDGYTYTVRRVKGSRTYWTCSIRGKQHKCPASVRQFADLFTPSLARHSHFPDPSAAQKVKISVKVKQVAREHISQSAREIVETVIREMTSTDDAQLPKPANLLRAANRHRQKVQPQEPQSSF